MPRQVVRPLGLQLHAEGTEGVLEGGAVDALPRGPVREARLVEERPAVAVDRAEERIVRLRQLLERRQPRLHLRAAAGRFQLAHDRRRQELTVGAFDDGGDLLQLAFEPLGGRHELRDHRRQGLARHVIVAGQQRRDRLPLDGRGLLVPEGGECLQEGGLEAQGVEGGGSGRGRGRRRGFHGRGLYHQHSPDDREE